MAFENCGVQPSHTIFENTRNGVGILFKQTVVDIFLSCVHKNLQYINIVSTFITKFRFSERAFHFIHYTKSQNEPILKATKQKSKV